MLLPISAIDSTNTIRPAGSDAVAGCARRRGRTGDELPASRDRPRRTPPPLAGHLDHRPGPTGRTGGVLADRRPPPAPVLHVHPRLRRPGPRASCRRPAFGDRRPDHDVRPLLRPGPPALEHAGRRAPVRDRARPDRHPACRPAGAGRLVRLGGDRLVARRGLRRADRERRALAPDGRTRRGDPVRHRRSHTLAAPRVDRPSQVTGAAPTDPRSSRRLRLGGSLARLGDPLVPRCQPVEERDRRPARRDGRRLSSLARRLAERRRRCGPRPRGAPRPRPRRRLAARGARRLLARPAPTGCRARRRALGRLLDTRPESRRSVLGGGCDRRQHGAALRAARPRPRPREPPPAGRRGSCPGEGRGRRLRHGRSAPAG